jgi:hypothetical protein
MGFTNAKSSRAAVRLADLQGAMGSSARFVQFTTRMAGVVQGGVRRGDHVKQMTVLAGNVTYDSMLRRSFDALVAELASPTFMEEFELAVAAHGIHAIQADMQDAIYGKVWGRKGLLTAYRQSLAGQNPDYTCEGVYEPLVLDGDVIPCAKVYVAGAKQKSGDKGAPVRGTLYFNGITINSKIIEPSPNGEIIPANSGIVPQLKEFLEAWLDLPLRKFRTYRLLPGTPYKFQCGAFTAEGT